jgi:hypothetical protein
MDMEKRNKKITSKGKIIRPRPRQMPADTTKDGFDESNAEVNTQGKRKGHRKEKRQKPTVRKGKQSPAKRGKIVERLMPRQESA